MPEKKPGPCPATKLEKGWWCAKCEQELADKDLKAGACAKCETKPARIEYCVRTDPAAKTADRCRIKYVCATCGEASDVESAFKHEDDCKKKTAALKKVCTKSGTAPHATPPK